MLGRRRTAPLIVNKENLPTKIRPKKEIHMIIKKSKLLCAGLLAVLSALSIVSCTNDETIETTKQEETLIDIDYTVGSTVLFNNVNYYVVSNTVNASSDRAVARTAENDTVSEMVATLSVERAKKYATEYFGKNILLIRTAGKVSVPNGKTSEYTSAYNAVIANMTENEKISDYFMEIDNATKNEVDYTDIYLILDSDKEKIGLCNVNWNSDLNKTFEDDKNLFDLIKEFSPNTIRKTVPGQYTIRKYNKTLKRSYDVMDNKLEEDGRIRVLENVKDSLYVSGSKGIIRAATIANEWDKDGKWIRSYISPSAIYGSSSMTGGITYTIRLVNGKYIYQIQGSSKISSERYNSRQKEITFDSNNKYSADNVLIPSNANIYSSAADLAYDENTLSVPVEFILNEDGSVSFGTSVYSWAKNWRDYIIATHESDGAYAYQE